MDSIGRYKILKSLGSGTMGKVYLAEDPQIGRQVAIKIIRVDGPGSSAEYREELEARFLQEARIVGRLAHQNIVAIHDIGTQDGLPWIAMELIEGVSLGVRMHDSDPELRLTEKIQIVRATALALAHAHAHGVVHRDVKPANIMVSPDGAVKVADFGIGKILDGSTEMTRTGMMIGSPSYMSPEQIRGDAIDSRTDLFSLGVVFYELVAGVRPFPADSITGIVYQIQNLDPPDPVSLRGELPSQIGRIIRRALVKNVDERYQTAGEVVRDLDALLLELSQTTEAPTGIRLAIPPLPASAAPPPRSRTIGLLFTGIAALAVAILAGAWFFWGQQRATETPNLPLLPPVGSATNASAPLPGPLEAVAPEATPVATTAPPPPRTKAPVVPAPEPRTAISRRPSPPTPTVPTEVPAEFSETALSGELDGTYTSRKRFKINVRPDQARLWLDGKPIGISDDWDGWGGGAYLAPGPGKHHLKAALPGYLDKNFLLEVGPQFDKERVDVEPKLRSGGRSGNIEKIPSPKGSTRGVVIFNVTPPTTTVTVDGESAGTVGDYKRSALILRDGPRSAVITLTPPSGKSVSHRVIVSSAGEESLELEERFD